MTDLDLLNQIRNQYTESRDFYYTRKLRQINQLKLLNNLNRGDYNIASTMLFSFFNRIMSNLYEDKIQIKFVPGEEMDYKRVETLNKLAVNDFREMDMPLHEYDWVWDTLFFGKGYIETLKFDKKRKIMSPSVINPLAFGSDPFFSNAQQWRYYWKWILKPGFEVIRLIKKGTIDGINNLSQIPSGLEADLWDFKVKRDQAKALTSTGDASLSLKPNTDVYQILEMATTDDDGNKLMVWVDKGFSHILMKEKLDLKDDENGSKWPIVVKELFRQPHSSVSYSVPDLIEDKHRAKSVLMNLAFIAAKDEANPLYQYVPEKVRDLTQLFSRQIQQHIPVDELNTSIAPLQTAPSLSASLLNFINLLTVEAQDPIGSGLTIPPVEKGGNKTATQVALQQQLNDLAQSLQSKVLQIGTKDFWSHWYQRYLHNTKEGDEKIITITSVKGVSFENIDLGDIKTKYPPKVEVYSAKEAEYKELVEKRDMMTIYPQFVNSMDPAGLKNFNKFIFLPKFMRDSSSIDLVLPKSIDEMAAERENDMLNINIMPDVKETDEHETHLYVHASAKNVPSTIAHKFWHEQLLSVQKKQAMMNAEMTKPNITPDERNPMEAAVPLNNETKKVVGTPKNKL